MQKTSFIILIRIAALALSAGAATLCGQILVPANVIVAPGDSASFPVTLATAAPANGVFITLSNSDSSTVTVVPVNIFIPEGATTPNRAPALNGIASGSSIITARASGLSPVSGQVQVGSNPTGPALPGINWFVSAPAAISAGQAAILSWSVSGATSVSIDNGVGDVSSVTSKSVSPAQTSTYTLTATNSAGSSTARVTVTLGTTASGQIIVPANLTVAPGGSASFPVTLATAAPANGVFITLASSDSSNVTVAPENIFIPQGAMTPNRAPVVSGIAIGSATVTAWASGLAPASGQVQVGSNPILPPAPTIISFTSTPSTITSGQSAMFSWSISGASTVSIDNGVGDVSHLASKSVSPTQTTAYILTAANSAGAATARVMVVVNSPPDTQPPTTPTLVSALPKGTAEVDLVWTASADNVGVAGYQISRNSSVLTAVSGAALSFADTGASPNTTYTYFVKAYDAAGNYSSGSNTLQVTTPSAGGTIVTSCQSITQSGHYVLGTNLSAPVNTSCINIHDGHDIFLDCQQHSVTIDRKTDPGNDSAIVVTNVTNYGVTNCAITALNITAVASLATLSVVNSPQGLITHNALSGGYVTIQSSDNLQIAHNTSNAPFSVSGNYQTIEYNTFGITSSYIVAAVLTLDNSTGSVIQNNVLNGGWDGAVRQSYNFQFGADDGIIASNVSNTTIQNNTILNTWDCGIENVKPMVNVQILNNQITTAGICGMGGWWGNSLRSVTIAGNTVTDAPRLIDFWRADGLYTGEHFLYFEDNTFSNNRLMKPRVSFSAPWAGRLDFQTLPAGIPANALVSGNNLITNNDFGPLAIGLKLLPGTSVVDGGGNICVPDSTPGFALHCIQPTPPSGGYYAITAFPATPALVAPGNLIIAVFGASPGTAGDYIGLAALGADDQHFLNTQLTEGAASNTLIFPAPANPGQYELRYMKSGAASHVAVSNPITVGQ